MTLRDLTGDELAVIELLITDVLLARESMLPIAETYDEPVQIADTVHGWLRGIRDTGKIQVK